MSFSLVVAGVVDIGWMSHWDTVLDLPDIILWRAVQWKLSVQDGDRRTQLGSARGLVWTFFGNRNSL